MKKRERIDWIDFAKGMAIIMVIMGHSMTKLGGNGIQHIFIMLISSFYMPLFFLLSGLNFRNEDTWTAFVNKKVKSLMYPTVVFSIVLFLYKLAYYYIENRVEEFKDIVYTQGIDTLLFTRNSMVSEYWFLPALFVSEMICFVFLKKWNNKKLLFGVSIILFIVVKVSNNYFKLILPLSVELALILLNFFVVGICLSQSKSAKNGKSLWIAVLGAGVLFFAGNAIEYIIGAGSVSIGAIKTGNFVLFWVNAYSGIAFTILLSKKIEKLKLINYFGRNSLYVYGIHYLFLELFCFMSDSILDCVDSRVIPYFAIVFVTLCCFIFCIILNYIKGKKQRRT